MFCSNCGKQLGEGAGFCGACGAAASSSASSTASTTATVSGTATTTPPRDFVSTWLFSWFLGSLGVDRFYLGYTSLGLGKLAVTIFSLGLGGWVWHTIDLILLLAGKLPDAQGRPLVGYAEKKRMAIWVTAGVSIGSLVLTLICFGGLIALYLSSYPAANY